MGNTTTSTNNWLAVGAIGAGLVVGALQYYQMRSLQEQIAKQAKQGDSASNEEQQKMTQMMTQLMMMELSKKLGSSEN